MTGTDLLLVEDDRSLSGLLVQLLTRAGWEVDAVPDAQAGLHHGLTRDYAVFVFDRGVPVMDGVELLRKLRARGVATPTLILTARGSLADRIEGLDAGAEDYLVKPFEAEELLARLRALTRRHVDRATVITLGDRHLDLEGRNVTGGPGSAAVGPCRRSTAGATAGDPRERRGPGTGARPAGRTHGRVADRRGRHGGPLCARPDPV